MAGPGLCLGRGSPHHPPQLCPRRVAPAADVAPGNLEEGGAWPPCWLDTFRMDDECVLIRPHLARNPHPPPRETGSPAKACWADSSSPAFLHEGPVLVSTLTVPAGFRVVQRRLGLGELQGSPGRQLSALRRGSSPLLPLGEMTVGCRVGGLVETPWGAGAEPPLPGAETSLGRMGLSRADHTGLRCASVGRPRVPAAHWLLGPHPRLWRVPEPPSRLLG